MASDVGLSKRVPSNDHSAGTNVPDVESNPALALLRYLVPVDEGSSIQSSLPTNFLDDSFTISTPGVTHEVPLPTASPFDAAFADAMASYEATAAASPVASFSPPPDFPHFDDLERPTSLGEITGHFAGFDVPEGGSYEGGHLDNSPRNTHSENETGESVSTERLLRSLVRSPKQSRPYKCDTCNKTCASWNALSYHKATAHTHEKAPYECTLCEARFWQRCNLKEHLQRHQGVKKHNCTVCDKGFVTKHELETHSLSHTHVKSHVCEICGKAYKHKSSLFEHRKKLGHQKVKK